MHLLVITIALDTKCWRLLSSPARGMATVSATHSTRNPDSHVDVIKRTIHLLVIMIPFYAKVRVGGRRLLQPGEWQQSPRLIQPES